METGAAVSLAAFAAFAAFAALRELDAEQRPDEDPWSAITELDPANGRSPTGRSTVETPTHRTFRPPHSLR
jgi:hypothetical protein